MKPSIDHPKPSIIQVCCELLIVPFKSCLFRSVAVAPCVLIVTFLFPISSAFSQQTYTIEGNEIDLTFERLDGTNVIFSDASGKQVKVLLARLSPDELRLLLKDVVSVVRSSNAVTIVELKSENQRTWRASGRTVRGKFKGVGHNNIQIDDGSLGLVGTEIDISDLQRTDLLYVIRHLASLLQKTKPADDKPLGKGAIDHEKREDDREKIGEFTEIKSRVSVSAPINHSFVDIIIDETQNRFLTVGSRKAVWWKLVDGSQISSREFSAGVQLWNTSPTGKYVLERYYVNQQTGSKTRIAVWDTQKQRKIFSPDYTVGSIVFSPDDKLIAYWTYADGKDFESEKENPRKLFLKNMDTGKTDDLGTYDGFRGFGQPLFSSDSEMITTNSDGKCCVWSTKTGEKKIEIAAKRTTRIAFDHDGRFLLVSSVFDHKVFNIDSGKLVSQLNTPGIRGMTFNVFGPNGKFVGGQDHTGKCFLWDRELNRMHSWQAHEKTIGQIEFTPDGKTIITSGSGRNAIKLWDLETKSLAGEFSSIGNSSFRMTKDGKRLVCFDLQNLVVCDVDELKRNYKIANSKIAKLPGKRVEKDEGLNPDWASLLACLQNETTALVALKPQDILAGKDLAKLIKENGIAKIAQSLSAEFGELHGYPYAIPAIQNQQLAGKFAIAGAEPGFGSPSDFKDVEFVQSNQPIDKDSLYKELIDKNGDSGMERLVHRGHQYVVGQNKRFAAFMPDAKTVLVAQNEATIKELIKQLDQPPTEIAKRANRELTNYQSLFLVNGELAQHISTMLLSRAVDVDASKQVVVTCNLSESPAIRLSVEYANEDAANKAVPKWQSAVDVYRDVQPQPGSFSSILEGMYAVTAHYGVVKNEGSSVIVEMDKTKVTNLVEFLWGPAGKR